MNGHLITLGARYTGHPRCPDTVVTLGASDNGTLCATVYDSDGYGVRSFVVTTSEVAHMFPHVESTTSESE